MKNMFSGMMIALALVLVLVVGVVALAESDNGEAPQLPEAGELQDAPETQEPQQVPEAQQPEAADDAAALQEALKALNEARQSAHEDDLQAELDGYVQSGKLTQEQADLIMNQYKEREAMRNGTCPSCGYQFQNGQGKGGRMNGNGFGRGGDNGGFGGKGNKGGRRGGFNGQSANGGLEGQSFAPGMQGVPQANTFGEGI